MLHVNKQIARPRSLDRLQAPLLFLDVASCLPFRICP